MTRRILRGLVFLLIAALAPGIIFSLMLATFFAMAWLWGKISAFEHWWLVPLVLVYAVLGVLFARTIMSEYSETPNDPK